VDKTGDEEIVETCKPSQADFWSVYLHDVEGGIFCIADCETKNEALVLRDLLTLSVKNYKDNGYLNQS
jgi:hypothetical protein